MKTYWIWLFPLCLSLSCTDDMEKVVPENGSPDLATKTLELRSSSLVENWDQMTTVQLKSGAVVKLPWSDNHQGNLSSDVLNDLDKKYGWRMLMTTIGTSDVGMNYMMFQNIYTGKLRIFYYMERNNDGGRGVWQLNWDGDNSLANSSRHFSLPNEYKSSSSICLTALTKADQLGVVQGWNCFETELNYDPSYKAGNTIFSIYCYNIQEAQLSLSGDYTSTSTGTIISETKTNPVSSALDKKATSLGNTAGDWIKNNIATSSSSSKPIKIVADIAGSVGSALVKKVITGGIGEVFGSFIGLFNKTSTDIQKLEFTTNGKVSLTGSMTSSTSNNVSPWANITHHHLGVWSVSGTPEIIVGKYALNKNVQLPTGEYALEKRYYLNDKSFTVHLNPDIQAQISSYSVSAKLYYYEKFDNKTSWRYDYKNFAPYQNVDEQHGVIPNKKILYDNGSVRVTDAGQYAGESELYITPTKPTSAMVPIAGLLPGYVVKLTLTLVGKDGNEATLCRTYLPKYTLVDNSSNPFSTETDLLNEKPRLSCVPAVVFGE